MAKTDYVQLAGGIRMPILYEDRSVLALDKAAGWMLLPDDRGLRNLQVALEAALAERPFWVRCRSLRFLRYVHRLDADTTGVLLLVKSRGALEAFSKLFEDRQVTKKYLAVVSGTPPKNEWVCEAKIAQDPAQLGRMRIHASGKESCTRFVVREKLATAKGPRAIVEAQPITGRTHQIRLHLAQAGCPVIGDRLYGRPGLEGRDEPLALRAIELSYADPFSGKRIEIRAPEEKFLRRYKEV